MKNLLLISLFLIIVSCSKEDGLGYMTPLSGHYKVVSIHSDVSADLNNDGVKTNDILFEIAGPHNSIDGKQISFFNFDSFQNYLEIRPLPEAENSAKLISFNFPSQHIDYLIDETPYLMMYQKSFIHYAYELNQNSKFIQLIDTNPDYDEKGRLKSLEVLENNELELALTKQVFDFVELDWVELNMAVKYKKVK